MNLTLFFRFALMAIFQRGVISNSKSVFGDPSDYSNTYFYLPRVYAKDGFSVSLQINNGHYCSSENGYRTFGHTFDTVEFGFTEYHEPMMDKYAETKGATDGTVGRISVSVMEKVFKKHGGIDWEKTLSVEAFNGAVVSKISTQ